MEILIRRKSLYMDVIVKDGSATFDLGLHNNQERRELAQVFLDAASELLEGLEDNTG